MKPAIKYHSSASQQKRVPILCWREFWIFSTFLIVSLAYSLLIGFRPSFSGLNFVRPTGTIAVDRTVFILFLWNLARSYIDFSRILPSLILGHTTIWAWIWIEFCSNHSIWLRIWLAFLFFNNCSLVFGSVEWTEMKSGERFWVDILSQSS